MGLRAASRAARSRFFLAAARRTCLAVAVGQGGQQAGRQAAGRAGVLVPGPAGQDRRRHRPVRRCGVAAEEALQHVA